MLKGQGDLLRGNINRYIYLKENDYKDKYYYILKEKLGRKLPKVIYDKVFKYDNLEEKFINWLKVYLSNEFKIRINNIKIYKINFSYDYKFKPYESKNTFIIEYCGDEI